MKPVKQILQILRSRRAFTEGTLLIPAHVVILPDYIANPTRWNGSVATLFAARDPPRNSTLIATSNPSTIQTPFTPHPITTIEGSEGNEPVITRLLQRSLGNTPTQLITTNALEPSTLISIRPDINDPDTITLDSGETVTRRNDDYSLGLSGGRPIWRPTTESRVITPQPTLITTTAAAPTYHDPVQLRPQHNFEPNYTQWAANAKSAALPWATRTQLLDRSREERAETRVREQGTVLNWRNADAIPVSSSRHRRSLWNTTTYDKASNRYIDPVHRLSPT